MKLLKHKWVSWGIAVALIAGISAPGIGQERARDLVRIPDILGYKALKCDFHIHTVYSDGNVWPSVRPVEAWMNGLDAMAITDHIEYLPHKDDLKIDFNRSYEIAKSQADALRVTLIRGSEITRDMPPGHINAIFLTDNNALDTKEWRDAVKAAHDQGAFLFWNHPGWSGQQPDGIGKWYDEHTELVDKGWIKGIEVVNSVEYYPEAQQWCLDKKLTMLGDSDVHDPIQMDYDPARGEHRPMTIVFAKENTAEAIHEALLDRRTVVYFKNWLIGEERFLDPIFAGSVELDRTQLTLRGKGGGTIQISNHAGIDFELALDGSVPDLSLPKSLVLPAGKAVMLNVRSTTETVNETRTVELPFRVTNLKVRPNEGLPVRLKVEVTFVAKKS